MLTSDNMPYDWVQIASLVVQILLLGGLVWYTVETWRIRKSSQEQIEATQKPFVTFSATAREFEAAVLEMGDAVGAMIVRCPEGNTQVENVGAGPAMNIRYSMTPVEPQSTRARPTGYLAGLRPGESFLLPVPRGVLLGREWECVFTFQSLSKRLYQTTIHLNGLVMTKVAFEPLAPTK